MPLPYSSSRRIALPESGSARTHLSATLLSRTYFTADRGFADEIDGDVPFAEEPAVFLAHSVHALAGCFHLVGTADALHEIIEGLPQLGFDFIEDDGGGLGHVHKITPFSSV